MRLSMVFMTMYIIYEKVLSKVSFETLLMKNYYRVDSGPLVMIYDTHMNEIDPMEMNEEA